MRTWTLAGAWRGSTVSTAPIGRSAGNPGVNGGRDGGSGVGGVASTITGSGGRCTSGGFGTSATTTEGETTVAETVGVDASGGTAAIM